MLRKTKQILKSKGYTLYTEPYKLNIVCYRSKKLRSNRFDDEIHVFYRNDKGKWIYHIFAGTTDPGQFWLDNPMNPQGTAFLKKGQYINAYAMGLHRGMYEALVQVKPVTVIRNYDRKGFLNLVEAGYEDKGMFGINVHRAEETGTTKYIDKYSAGCVVFASAKDYALFLQLCRQHRQYWGNRFTLTLVDFRDERKRAFKRVAYTSLFTSSAFLFSYYYYQKQKNHATFKKFQKSRFGFNG